MSFFGRMLASIGIGAVRVDTVLERPGYAPGEDVRGVVRVFGGQIEQRLDAIDLSVMTSYLREMNDTKVRQYAELARIRVAPPQTVAPGERKEVPFSFVLPPFTPLTLGHTRVWIRTEAEVRAAVDPTDEDGIQVYPSVWQRTVLEAIEALGFRLREAETVYAPRLGRPLPFVQEFEWVPYGGPYRGRLDELEVVFLRTDASGLTLLLQIDRKARSLLGLFAEAMDADESFVRVTVAPGELAGGPQRVAGLLDSVIARYA